MSGGLAVVGGGPAGLSAAWSLASAGYSLTLYERDHSLGGLLRTRELDGLRLDVAVQLLGSYYDETFKLASAVGGSGLLVRSPGRDALWRGGRPHHISYGSVASMAGSGALPTGLKLRLASRYLLYLRRHSGILDPADPVRASPLDRESIASWGRRELGEDFVELLAYPQLAAYYGTTPEETSAGFYHTLASAGLDLQLYAIRGGVSALADTIATALEARGSRLRLGLEITRVQEDENGVSIEWEGGSSRHDAVVLAIPAPSLLSIADLADPLRHWLSRVHFAEEAVIALSLEGSLSAGYFGLSFPRTTPPGEGLAAICLQSQKGAGLEVAGREALVVIPAPTTMGEVLRAEPRQGLDLIMPAVERVYPGIRERVTQARIYRFPGGRSIFYPGYLTHLSNFDPEWLSGRIAIAGDYLISPTVEGAVRSGLRAALALRHRSTGGH